MPGAPCQHSVPLLEFLGQCNGEGQLAPVAGQPLPFLPLPFPAVDQEDMVKQKKKKMACSSNSRRRLFLPLPFAAAKEEGNASQRSRRRRLTAVAGDARSMVKQD